MAGLTYTYSGNQNAQNADAALETSQGWVPIGQSGLFLPSEVQALTQDGAVLTLGPAATPASQITAPALAAGASGTPNGVYRCCVTFVTAAGETLAGPEATITVSSTHITWSSLPVGLASSGVTGRKLYRTAAAGIAGSEKLVTTISDNTTLTFDDNVADGSLGAVLPTADTSAVAVDLTHFAWTQAPAGTTLGQEGL